MSNSTIEQAQARVTRYLLHALTLPPETFTPDERAWIVDALSGIAHRRAQPYGFSPLFYHLYFASRWVWLHLSDDEVTSLENCFINLRNLRLEAPIFFPPDL